MNLPSFPQASSRRQLSKLRQTLDHFNNLLRRNDPLLSFPINLNIGGDFIVDLRQTMPKVDAGRRVGWDREIEEERGLSSSGWVVVSGQRRRVGREFSEYRVRNRETLSLEQSSRMQESCRSRVIS